MTCAFGLCEADAALLHNDTGYCVWHYRSLPDTILNHVQTP